MYEQLATSCYIKVEQPSLTNDLKYNAQTITPPRYYFLSCVSILLLTRDIDIVIMSVCLSVRDTLVLYENGLTYRHSFSTVR